MSDIQIISLSEKPEFADTCAAWSYGEWVCHIEGRTLERSIRRYRDRAKNTTNIPNIPLAMKIILMGSINVVVKTLIRIAPRPAPRKIPIPCSILK